MIADIVRTVGAVSVLVNNAGVSSIREINEVTLEDFDLMIRTNCRSAFVCTQAVIGAMQKQRWGRIINLTSIAAYTGGLTGPHYAASKAGMIGLTNAYAHRLVKFGITSNAVSPGLCDSDMLSEMGRAIGGMDKVIANTKPGRLGTADEVAVVVAMLARNGYVNGQTIGVGQSHARAAHPLPFSFLFAHSLLAAARRCANRRWRDSPEMTLR